MGRVKVEYTIDKDFGILLSKLKKHCFVSYNLSKEDTEDIIMKAVLFHLEHPERFDSGKSSLLTYLQIKCGNFAKDMFRTPQYMNTVYLGTPIEYAKY